MLPRHVKLVIFFSILFFLSLSAGLYLYVAFHFAHVWSLFFVCMCHFCMLIAPAVCLGYDDPELYRPSNMSEETFRNNRDMGNVAAVVFYLLSYVPTTVAWYGTDGIRPPFEGVVCVYVANAACFTGYVLWRKQFTHV